MKKIVKITDLDGNDRTDGHYPNRIGTVCEIAYLEIGVCMFLEYISREGSLKTSTVTSIEDNKITTLNSIYYFEDVVSNEE